VTISEIRARNRAAGREFFSHGARRFFASRNLRPVCPLPDGGALFVTSECAPGDYAPRRAPRYTVREMTPTGEVYTASGFTFQQFGTASEAVRAMREAARARA